MDLDNFKGVLLGHKFYSGDLVEFYYNPDEFLIEVMITDGVHIRYVGNLNKTINVPRGVKELVHTFSGMYITGYINIPETVSILGDYCFYRCDLLSSVYVPDSVTRLGENCFANCISFYYVRLPKHLRFLPRDCFYRCGKLDYITLPDNLEGLDIHCFEMQE